MTEREVVFDRVIRIELAEGRGDFLGGRPARGSAVGEAEIHADSVHVSIDGDQQLGGRDRPQPEIDAVRRPYHPASVEKEPLTRAPSARIADEVARAPFVRLTTKPICETGEGLTKVASCLAVVKRKRLPEGSVLLQQEARMPKHASEMRPAIDPVDEPIEALLELLAAVVGNQTRRLRTHHVEDALDAVTRSDRIAECKARRNEADDFAIGLAGVPMYVVDWIPRA